jgi:hypothetical protein
MMADANQAALDKDVKAFQVTPHRAEETHNTHITQKRAGGKGGDLEEIVKQKKGHSRLKERVEEKRRRRGRGRGETTVHLPVCPFSRLSCMNPCPPTPSPPPLLSHFLSLISLSLSLFLPPPPPSLSLYS